MHKHYIPLFLILGLFVVAIGFFAIYRNLKNGTETHTISLASATPNPTTNPTPVLGIVTASPTATPKIDLAIDSPLALSSVSSSLLTVAGKSATGAAVLVNEKEVTVNADGSFRSSLRLVPGPNLVVIQASSSAGSSIWQTVVTYTKKEPVVTDAPQQETTP